LPSRKAEATFEALRSHMTLGRSSEQKTSKLVIRMWTPRMVRKGAYRAVPIVSSLNQNPVGK
jgi:hypothetical protein